MPDVKRPWFPLCIVVAALGCGSPGGEADAADADADAAEDAPPFTGLCPPSWDEEAPVALFDPFGTRADRTTPIPSNVWTRADPTTTTGLRPDGAFSAFDEAFALLDGFGLIAPIVAPFDWVVDPASLDGTAGGSDLPRLFLLDADGLGAPTAGEFAARLVPIEKTVAQTGSALVFPFRRVVAVRPLAPLEPNHRYAMVVTSCLADPEGRGLRADDAFAALRDGATIDPRLEATRADVEPVLAWLEDPAIGLDRGSVALATVFTTQSVYEDSLAMAEHVADAPPSDLTVTRTYDATDGAGNLNPEILADYPGLAELLADLPLGDYHFDAIGTVVIGTFTSPAYLDEGDILHRDAAGAPEPLRDDTLQFLAVLPAEDPAHGIGPPFPTVVYQHAFTTCKETMIAVADTFARFGIALVGIDMVMHGSRHPDGPGGCTLDAGAFFDTGNFVRTTDRVRQSVVDILAFVRALRGGTPLDVLPGPDGDGDPDLELGRLAIAGQSMGASIEMNALALSPDLGAGLVNVGGGVFTNLMLASMVDDPDAMDLPHLALTHIAMALGAQTCGEKADPIHFARRLLADPLTVGGVPAGTKQILYQEAVDETVFPNFSTELTARTMGIVQVEPIAEPIAGLSSVASPVSGNLPGGGTAGLFQFVGAEHEFLLRSDDPALMRGGQLQAAIFLSTWLETGTGVIVDPFDATQVAPYDPGNLPW
ncbi:MAG: hypothetical protein HY905_06135 [Deltaproteobacteria bacterium]|nr:hypothetical protein [Deltaproteobacteria bacterium]